MFKKFLIYGGFSLLTTLLGIISLPVLTNFLTPSEYGVLGLALTFISILLPFNTLSNQGNVQVTRSTKTDAEFNIFFNSLCTFSAILSIFILTITLICILFFEFPLIILIIPVVSFLRSLRILKLSELTILDNNMLFGFSTLIVSIIAFLLTFSIFYFLISGALVRFICLGLAEIFVLLCVLKLKFKFCYDKKQYSNILLFGLPLILSSLPALVIHESGKYFLLKSDGLETVGLYTLSFQIAVVYLQFNNVLNNTFVKKVFDDISAAFDIKFIILITLIQIFSAVAFSLAIKFLSVYFLPDEYLPSIPFAILLVGGMLFQSFSLLPSYYFSYYNMNKYKLYSISAASVISISLNYFFISRYGAVGAALVFFLSMTCYSLLMFYFLYRQVLPRKFSR
jgi:O-antigen/teichoic acid export membrane protein